MNSPFSHWSKYEKEIVARLSQDKARDEFYLALRTLLHYWLELSAFKILKLYHITDEVPNTWKFYYQ